ncbi:formate--tetrahydrofolate ligase [Thermomicrobiaceae bacterium CFH 74404]|uniref:Formate--tetrahydrofolate ligase n=1 Tax=Thermalbibacter longus TaxID=2951981 RepID=A0AA42B9T8_9BACT|nr:formate--tetrahydrofolate ligase [Thermalbibacter longus]MCM8747674.1 formate--tetrahydrofolate ligase [Thermalbibacter longus]
MSAVPRPIVEIAEELGLEQDEIELYGQYKAKVKLEVLERLTAPRAKYVLVTGTTPTQFGEGKTTMTIGLGQAFKHLGLRSVVTVRQSSLGPVFGTKGAGAGGGAAQVLPFPDIALHFTGDGHAVTAAHNLCSAFLDNALYHGDVVLDPRTVTWPRVLDVNDRALRHIVTGLNESGGLTRSTRFDITAASEVMAILALARDYRDLRERIGRIVVGFTYDNQPVTAEQLRVAGPMTALLVDALKPNLVQTTEHTPAFVHTGPFGNIAHGNSSVIADLIATRLAEVVLTEAGFGTELGAEKFFHIKCRGSGLVPDAAVLVTSVRSIKAQGGLSGRRGRIDEQELAREDLGAVEAGLPNLAKHIENIKAFGVPVVVAVNRFPTDSERELDRVCCAALDLGAEGAAVASVYADGGPGGLEVARALLRAFEKPKAFRPLYDLDAPFERKVEVIARTLYGAGSVRFTAAARRQLAVLTRHGYDRLPVCMAKTPLSLSADPTVLGRPEGFEVQVRELRLLAGAGFVTVLLGDIQTMPALGRHPLGAEIDVDEHGVIHGLR